MAKRINPFKPTAGMNPPELIGRDTQLADFADALDNGPGSPDRLLRISGVRGVGKTVLLNALGDVARERKFQVIDVAASPGFADRILSALQRRTEMAAFSIAPEVIGVKLGSVDFARPATQLGEAMLAASKRGGLFITLDEIQDAPVNEMREFGNEIQLLIRQGADVAFAFAGLPSSVDGVVAADALTFLQRAKHIELSRLPEFEVEASLEETMAGYGNEPADSVSGMLADASAGYPFMVQLVGYYSWQAASRRGSDRVCVQDAEKGVEIARRSFDGMVIEPALRRLSSRQLEYLAAMAQCDEGPVSSGEVAERMGSGARDVSTFRRRLIEAAIIVPVGYGKAEFAIPYMRDYLREHEEELR